MYATYTTAKTLLGRTKPSTGPHAARGLVIGGENNAARHTLQNLFLARE